jgi:biotin carboxylase
LIDALLERGISFSLWQEKPLFTVAASQFNLVAPLWQSPERIREQIRASFPDQHFSHVIAGTESGVVAASVSRRQLGARVSGTLTGTRCRDKLLMKKHLAGFGIPMTRFLGDCPDLDPASVFATLGSPVVRKFRKSSGGKGMQLLRCVEEYVPGRHGKAILERFIDAPEASIESFIDRGRICFTNITSYHSKGHSNFVPASFDPDLERRLLALNERCIGALGISWGMTHLEVYLTAKGPLFGEIALRPPGGYIMNALQHAWDFNPWRAFLAMELGESFSFPERPVCYAAAEVLHPGAGTVRAVHGKARVLDEQGIQEFRIKVKPGDVIDERKGLGQDAGYLVHTSDTPEARHALHERITRTLHIELMQQTTDASPSRKA